MIYYIDKVLKFFDRDIAYYDDVEIEVLVRAFIAWLEGFPNHSIADWVLQLESEGAADAYGDTPQRLD